MKNAYAVKNVRTGKIVRKGFSDKMKAKEVRNELNETRKDTHVVTKGEGHPLKA